MYYKLSELKSNIKNINTTDVYHFLLDNDNLSQNDIDFICNELAFRRDAYYIYWTAKEFKKANIKILQKGLIQCDKPEYIEPFIKNIPGFTYESLYQHLLELKSGSAIQFAYQYFKDADKQILEDILIQTNDMFAIMGFLNTSEFDFDRLKNVIINSDDKEAIFALASLFVTDPQDLTKIEDRMIELNDAQYITDLAKYIGGVNIEKLYDAVLNINDANAWFIFARDVEGIDIKRAEDKIVKIKQLVTITSFAMSVKGADTKRLEDVIIESKSLSDMSEFLFNVREADRERLIKAIVDTNNHSFIADVASQLGKNESKFLIKYYKTKVNRERFKITKQKIKLNKKIIEETANMLNSILQKRR